MVTRGEKSIYHLLDTLWDFTDLQKVSNRKDRTYRIEKITKTCTTKKKFFLVKWRGWSPTFNSWVSAEDIAEPERSFT